MSPKLLWYALKRFQSSFPLASLAYLVSSACQALSWRNGPGCESGVGEVSPGAHGVESGVVGEKSLAPAGSFRRTFELVWLLCSDFHSSEKSPCAVEHTG